MCGIAGYVDWEGATKERLNTIEHMGTTLVCRGPDADGTFVHGPVAFAHRRLIVIDPEGGIQPMVRRVDGRRYVITYNGELYNMDELRRELELCGHTFETRSDTELLLLSYVQWGPQCVEKLNGIFAFGIWSETDQTLFLARDRLGVKPLFYTERGHLFVFGSELKALLAHPNVPAEVDLEGLAELLLIGPAHTPGHAVFKGIHELRPGYSLLYSQSGTKITQYWRLESHPHEDDVETTADTVRELLRDAVSRQLVSDVPVVTFLSGGLDSSAVSALAAEAFQADGRGPLHTYSIDFANMDEYFEANAFQTGRDTPFARRVSKYLGTIHHEIVFDTPDLIEHLTRPLAARDLPGMADIDTSLYLFCKEIKKEATVALSGEAADEVFGGYPWFHREDALQADTFPWSLQLEERIRLLSKEFLARLNPIEYVKERYHEALAEVPKLPGETREEERLREISYLNITRFLTTLLERKDRMSMATGLEVRVPFCDHRLVEYVWNIPWKIKRFDGTAKAILRKAMVGILPDDVVYRRKSPYPSTHNPAYLAAVREWVEQILDDKTQPIHALINESAVRELIQASYNKLEHRPWFGQIMATPQMFDYLIQINTWLKTYNVQITW
ncbi:asparagine synthase (glutamine-hydrolyzing) [Sulfoacidibacillus thermotolerans]|uniref:asparagine synthase (glutamine-hydrolyzing) n=1 Tax=Sulfoacidibacillus thermotolerans TaxID=1765684 RepID=A0A2U3D8D5_SULT2|nr:asparagine synthase (glutamine-hydrolyzing) [Sulfoacidibacillus thermotolerans]PWI57540.1 asparagine synthase (glutamine-hydrolyzing) [Sulfoacidibacillus thermotolerans]